MGNPTDYHTAGGDVGGRKVSHLKACFTFLLFLFYLRDGDMSWVEKMERFITCKSIES